MDVRPLRAGEESALLDLLAQWPSAEGWPMRELLGRYVEDEPAFDPRDVWVAADGARLVSCVQIFPRQLRLRGRTVPIGGFGSVFTDPERRGGGASHAVLRAAMADLAAREMELGLLFTGIAPFYEKLGWRSWPVRRPLLRPRGPRDGAALERGEPFAAPRDLAEVQALHAGYSARRDGTSVRDPARWWTNLRHAGNPGEEFRVVREAGHVVAYLRAVSLAGFLVLMEWGRADDAVDALADLFVTALTARGDDPLASDARPSIELRGIASAPPLLDAPLAGALAERRIETTESTDPGSLFFVARPEALAHRFGEPYPPRGSQPEEGAFDLLRTILPPERFAFWPADRF